MNCPYCNVQLPANSDKCPGCGASLPVAPQEQPVQAAPQPTSAAAQSVVVQVGNTGAAVSELSNRSRLTYILLGLFLGGFGSHNFYAGRTGVGIAQAVITMINSLQLFSAEMTLTIWVMLGAWVLVEVIVCTRDGQGKKLY